MPKVILIVEDEPKNMKLARDLIQVAGYSSIEAVNGKQAVALARSQKPDLILMDIQMPIMSGLEATQMLKADPATRHIPIIALTAFAMKNDERQISASGCDGYITKPIRIRDFINRITEHLGGA